MIVKNAIIGIDCDLVELIVCWLQSVLLFIN